MTDGQYPDDEIFAPATARRRNPSSPTRKSSPIGLEKKKNESTRAHSSSKGSSVDSGSARKIIVGALLAVGFVGLTWYGLASGGPSKTSSLASGATTVPATVGDTSSLPSNQKAASSPGSTTSVVRDSAPTTLAQNVQNTQTTTAPSTTTAPKTTNTPPTTVISTTTTVSSVAAASSASTNSTLPPGVNPANANITVRVANATNVAGAATAVTEELGNLDFNVLGPANAPTINPPSTIVYYSSGFQVAGDAVARILGVPQSQVERYTSGVEIGAVAPSDVNVVLGLDVAAK